MAAPSVLFASFVLLFNLNNSTILYMERYNNGQVAESQIVNTYENTNSNVTNRTYQSYYSTQIDMTNGDVAFDSFYKSLNTSDGNNVITDIVYHNFHKNNGAYFIEIEYQGNIFDIYDIQQYRNYLIDGSITYSVANLGYVINYFNNLGVHLSYSNILSNVGNGVAYYYANDYWVPMVSSDVFVFEEFYSITFFDNRVSYNTTWTDGYEQGMENTLSGWNLSNFLYSIVDIPVLYLRSMFGFDLFGGVSLFSVIVSLITISIVLFVIRKFVG